MIEQFYDLKPQVLELDRKTLELCRDQFAHLEEIRDYNQLKMLRAFTDCGVEARHFLGSTGYGVWDDSRNKLEEVFSRCMGAEDALVRPQFMSGTHTLTVALFGLLRAGDTLLAATGRPYDTLEGVIGIGEAGKGCGTLQEYGIHYDEVPLLPDFTPDYAAIAEHAKTATVVHIQRSRGYTQRNAFDLDTIQKVADTARKANPDVVIFVDNCYGEFTQIREPLSAGADVIAGSFIKNPGGGITPTGGYIAGKADLVEKISHRFTAPGIGKDLGCTQDSLRDTFLGFYYAPGVVCEALKTAVYAQCLLELVGVNPVPRYTADDLRLLNSGPRCGFNDLNVPARQAGSSIMPAKVNPVIPECVNQCCFTIFGMDVTVNWAVAEGQLQLNAFDPVMVHELLTGMALLTHAMETFRVNCVEGIEINADLGRSYAQSSPSISAALNHYIGYEHAADIAAEAVHTGRTVREVAGERTDLPAEQLDEILDPIRLARGLGQTCRERQE